MEITIEALLSLVLIKIPEVHISDITKLVREVKKEFPPDSYLLIDYDRDSWYFAFNHVGTFLRQDSEGWITVDKSSIGILNYKQYVYDEFFYDTPKELLNNLKGTIRRFPFIRRKNGK